MGQTAIAEKLNCTCCDNSSPDEKQITTEIKSKHTPKTQESKPLLKQSEQKNGSNEPKLEQKNGPNGPKLEQQNGPNGPNPSENEKIKSQSYNENDYAPNQNSIADDEILNELIYGPYKHEEEENDDEETKKDDDYEDVTEEKLEANDAITYQQNIANSKKKNKWRKTVKPKKGTKAAQAAEAFEYATAVKERRKPIRKPIKKKTKQSSKAIQAAQAFEAAEAAKAFEAAEAAKGHRKPTKIATKAAENQLLTVAIDDREAAMSKTMLKQSIFLKRGSSKMKLTRDSSWVQHQRVGSPQSGKYEFDNFMLNRKVSKLGKNLLGKYDSGKNVLNAIADENSSDEEF